MMMQVNKFIPIDEKYTDHDYLFDKSFFEIRYAFNTFAPYLFSNEGKYYPFSQRFVENKFNSETGSGDIMYYPNYAEDGDIMKLYNQKELYTLIDDEIVCIDNNSLLYPFIEHFAQGFTRGYFEVKNNLEIENNVQTVFNIAVNESLSGLGTAYETHNLDRRYIKFLSDELIFESGVKTGRNYRAWQVILDKPYLYVDFFRKSESLIGHYRWCLEYEIEQQNKAISNGKSKDDPLLDAWGRKKGLDLLLKHNIDPQLLQKVEKEMLDIGSLKPAVISNENEIDGIVITDEMRKRTANAISLMKDYVSPIAGIQESVQKMVEAMKLPLVTLSQRLTFNIQSAFTPEIQESFRLFGERMREKAANEADRYNNNTHVGMKIKYSFDYLLLTEKEKSDFFHFVIFSFDREDDRFKLPLYSFVMSITDREWQDCGMKYYALQKKKSFDAVEEFEKLLSAPPAPKGIEQEKVKKEQKGGNRIKALQRQKQIDILKNAVTELCKQNKGKTKNDRLNLSQLTNLALSTKDIQSYKTLDRHIKYFNLGRTHKDYIGQLVRQYCTDNSLTINYFD